MRLKNKKTGEIVDHIWWDSEIEQLCVDGERMKFYDSLAELNAEWEDYEEPKVFYVVDLDGEILPSDFEDETIEKSKELGNYFETKEEAKKAVEKLKAWKRLKDKGFRFNGIEVFSEGLLKIAGVLSALEGADNAERLKIIDDLDLLFGGEE